MLYAARRKSAKRKKIPRSRNISRDGATRDKNLGAEFEAPNAHALPPADARPTASEAAQPQFSANPSVGQSILSKVDR
jgi:hypothetical protein